MLLKGVRIVEVASVITGPYAGMLLADLGAEVIKIEAPPSGDAFRGWDGSEDGVRPAFAAYNRGKYSVRLDLKSEADQAALWHLLEDADALIANMRTGAMDRLGFSWEALHRRNPNLVYCSISGLGSSGPDANRPTFDAVAQALSGLWSQLGNLEDPVPVGPPIADQLTGMYAAMGTAAALCGQRSGRGGTHLEVDMLGACLAFQGLSIANLLQAGEIPGPDTRARTSQAYGFVAGDGKPFCIHLSTAPKFWKGLCDAVGHPQLADDERFATKTGRVRNYDLIRAELAAIFSTQPRDVWLAALDEHDVPGAPILNLAEALEYPQTTASSIVGTPDSGDDWLSSLCRSPISVDGRHLASDIPAPVFNQDAARFAGAPARLETRDSRA
jgi:crotonobetainyl-CoA:carnitine CoA-transferase CaiB-like acyl-CoA transferase